MNDAIAEEREKNVNTAIKLNRYNDTNFWRVVFTFAIAIFHFGGYYPEFFSRYNVAVRWRIGVEFFFIVSGFLLAYKCESSKMTAWEYTKSKFKRLYPEYLFMLLLVVSFMMIDGRMSIYGIFWYLFNLIDELLLVQASCVSYLNVNGVPWYISSMVICGYFIYWMYKNKRELFVGFIAPLSMIVIYAMLYKEVGALSGHLQLLPIYVSVALCRGFAGMTVGVLVYEAYKKLNRLEFTRWGEVLLTFIEILGYGTVLLATLRENHWETEFLCVPILAVCVAISFSRKKKNVILHNPIVDYLSKISYSIYLNQILVLRVFSKFFSSSDFKLSWLFLYLAVTVALAAVANAVSMGCTKALGRNWGKIKSLFVKQNVNV
ncbi:MAG: acyltransferase family protein [Oscillospiraceae bacterium]